MAKILLTWELGGALGHITRLRELAEPLSVMGHRIFLASKDLTHVEDVFGDIPVTVLQAPQSSALNESRIRKPEAFSHILYNNGYAKVSALKSLVSAWRNLIELVAPDVVVADHSPTALLACCGLVVKKVAVGAGFPCPPPEKPLGVFSSETLSKKAYSQILQDEELVLENINQVLQGKNLPHLEKLADIYIADIIFLTTLPELDHFGTREGGQYYGLLPTDSPFRPDWPGKQGRKIFAYLKPFAKLPYLLRVLQQTGLPTLIYANNIPEDYAERFSSDSLRFVRSPVDLSYAASQCDLAIVHANHGTSTQLLLNGVPLLMLPLHREQGMYAKRAAGLGVGIITSINNERYMAPAVNEMLKNSAYKEKAAAFAAQYKGFDFKARFSEIITAIHELAVNPEGDGG